jgi:hypothetical protein
MNSNPNHRVLAQRYADCACVHICCAERAPNAKERAYHLATASEYLLLAESELRAIATKNGVSDGRHNRLFQTACG